MSNIDEYYTVELSGEAISVVEASGMSPEDFIGNALALYDWYLSMGSRVAAFDESGAPVEIATFSD